MNDKTTAVRRKWLVELLVQAGYTHSAFAQASGVSRQTLEKLINGTSYPSDKISRRIKDQLGVPDEWWSNPPKKVMDVWEPPNKKVVAVRHINCIGEVALPAAFRKALGWSYGIDVDVRLDKKERCVIISAVERDVD